MHRQYEGVEEEPDALGYSRRGGERHHDLGVGKGDPFSCSQAGIGARIDAPRPLENELAVEAGNHHGQIHSDLHSGPTSFSNSGTRSFAFEYNARGTEGLWKS
jgi:hypothetical protein